MTKQTGLILVIPFRFPSPACFLPGAGSLSYCVRKIAKWFFTALHLPATTPYLISNANTATCAICSFELTSGKFRMTWTSRSFFSLLTLTHRLEKMLHRTQEVKNAVTGESLLWCAAQCKLIHQSVKLRLVQIRWVDMFTLFCCDAVFFPDLM